jgi:hypothetical protein
MHGSQHGCWLACKHLLLLLLWFKLQQVAVMHMRLWAPLLYILAQSWDAATELAAVTFLFGDDSHQQFWTAFAGMALVVAFKLVYSIFLTDPFWHG